MRKLTVTALEIFGYVIALPGLYVVRLSMRLDPTQEYTDIDLVPFGPRKFPGPFGA